MIRSQTSALLLALAAAACGGGADSARADGQTAQPSAAAPAPAAGDTTTLTAGGTLAPSLDSVRRVAQRRQVTLPPRAAGSLTEEDVHAVLDAINAADARMSGSAVHKVSSPELRRFAGVLSSLHRQKVTDRPVPPGSDIAGALVAPMRDVQTETVARLGTLPAGPAFDRAYVEALVESHERALAVLDSVAPRATDGSLPTLVSGMRAQVHRHLDEARALQRRLP